MRRSRNRDLVVFGVSFLDVLATTIGGLAFLLVLAVLAVGVELGFPDPIITTEVLDEAYEGEPYQVWLAAREGLGRFEWRIDGEVPEGLDLDPLSGLLSGSPSEGGEAAARTYEFDVVVTATGPDDERKTDTRRYSLTVHRGAPVPVPPVRIVTEPDLPDAFLDVDYPLTLAAEGGQPPYQWAGQGPPGLTLQSDGTLSGRPSQTGTFSFQVEVTTNRGDRDTRGLTLLVSERHPPPPPVPPLEIVTDEVAPAVAERGYAVAPAAQGGTPPYRWDLLATGLSWLTADGVGARFGGTPAFADVTETSIRWRVTDAEGRTIDSDPMPFEVLPPAGVDPPPLELRTRSLPEGRVGDPYDLALAANGGFPPYSWGAQGLDATAGVTLDSIQGRLMGEPTSRLDDQVTLVVRDRVGQVSRAEVSLRIRPRLTPVRILTRGAPEGRAGAPWDLALSAVGGFPPYRWALIGGEIPPGLGLDDQTGVISGAPAGAGTWSARVSALDAEGNPAAEPADLDFTVLTRSGARPLVIRTDALPTLLRGTDAAVTLAADGGQPPVTWSADPLPEGLTVEEDRIVGAPGAGGRADVTLTARDADGQTASVTLPLQVRHVAPFWLALLLAAVLLLALALLLYFFRRARVLGQQPVTLEVKTGAVPNARASSDYDVHLACVGGVPPYEWTVIEGELPPGLELEPDGRLHGRAFEGVSLDETKEFAFTVRVKDAMGETAEAGL